MDLIRLNIPATFVSERASVSWRDVRFGLENELLDPQAAVDLAVEDLAILEHPPAALVELAGAARSDPKRALVDQLANPEPEQAADEIRDKWLYIVLAWIYEQKDRYEDSLRAVEEVYADFGYPEHIAGLVRYMPMDEPELGSREANEHRLFERWKQYLDQAAAAYAPSRPV